MATPNTTLGRDHYVAILKGKQGELGALSTASPDRLVPLVELLDEKAASNLTSSWDTASVLWVQPFNFDGLDDAVWADEVEKMFDILRSASLKAVPVVTTEDGPDVLDRLKAIIAVDGRGAVIRLDAEEAAVASKAAVKADIDDLLGSLGLAPDVCDLVLDVGLVRNSLASRVATAEAALASIPYLQDWRNLATAFSAFPDSLTEYPKSHVSTIARDDASAYVTLIGRGPDREPIFGDYAIGTPYYATVAWSPIPAIRYTSDLSWMVHRAATKQNRSPQYVALCGQVRAASYFAGSGFSAGDAYIDAVASGHAGPGNPMTYVRAGTSHHLATVLDRLATVGAP